MKKSRDGESLVNEAASKIYKTPSSNGGGLKLEQLQWRPE